MSTTCVCGHEQSRHRWPIDRDLTACRVHGCVCDDYRNAEEGNTITEEYYAEGIELY